MLSSLVVCLRKNRDAYFEKDPRRGGAKSAAREPASLEVLDCGDSAIVRCMNNERIIPKRQQHHDTCRKTQ
jgi:hypothetical protein